MDIDQISFGIKASAGKASTSLDRLVQSLDKLNDAFARVQTSGSGAIDTLNGIVSASSGIKTGLKGASASAKTTSTAMKQVTATTRQTSTALNTMRSRLKTVGSAMVGVHRDTKTATSGMSRLIQKITQITFVVYVARRALRAFGQGIKASIAYVENLNLFMVALGENTSRATGFIKEMSESLYLDEAQLTRVQGLFYQISEALGLSSDKAYTLSENFTKLAYDLASFYNITIEDAVTKLQAGLVGETEPLRRIGIIITENNLAETARNLGIKKSIRNMTEMEKIQLRYVTALQQTKNAQGDLARTLEQPENLLRILREQFHVLMRELGNVAIPIIKKLIPQVIGLTMALADLARQMAKTLGYDAPEIRDDLGGFMKTVSDESNDIEKSTDNTQKNWAKILKYTRDSASAMTGIDELNVLSDDESGLTGASIDDLFPTADDVKSQIDLGIDDYNNNMEASKGIFDDIILKWKTLFTEIGKVFETTKTAVKGLWDEVFGGEGPDGDRMEGLRIMNEIVTGIANGATDIVKYFKELYNDALKPVFELIAPDWFKNLSEGTGGELAKAVAFLTKAFIVWKTIKFASNLIMGLAHILTIGGMIAGPTGLLALFTAMGAIKIGFDIADAIEQDSFDELGKTLKNAIIAGLGAAALTGSVKNGAIVFNIVALLDLDLGAGWRNLIEAGTDKIFGPKEDPNALGKALQGVSDTVDLVEDNFQDTGIGKVLGMFDLVGALIDLGTIIKNTLKPTDKKIERTPRNYANGGVPEKGNLFVAGEKGPELVTEHNGETVVMNEQQLKDRGISLYADGVNVPKWNRFERAQVQAPQVPSWNTFERAQVQAPQVPSWTSKERMASAGYTADNKYRGESIANLTTAMDKMNSDIGEGLVLVGEKIWDGLQWLGEIPVLDQMKEGAKFIGKWASKGFKVGTEVATGLPSGLAGFGQAFMNTKLVKGVSDAFKKFKENLEEGDGVLSKTYRAFKKVGEGAISLLLNSFDKFANSKSFQSLFKSAPDEGGSTLQQQEAMGGIIGGILGEGPAGQIFALAQHIADGTVGKFLESAPLMIEAGVDFLENLLVGMVEAMPAIIEAIPEVIETIVGVLTNKDSLNMIIESLVSVVASIVQALPDIIFALVDAIPDIVMTLIEVFVENLPLFLKLGVAIGVAILEGIANLLIGGINAIIHGINKIIPGSRWDIDKIGKADFSAMMPKFADGGFPNQGQMFIAREAGAELVGNIGGSTAVANNDQIVTAVSDGVYRAVSQAMSEQGGQRVSLRVDGRRMSEAMDLASKKRGLAFGTGGY
jgi:hypothetical protein